MFIVNADTERISRVAPTIPMQRAAQPEEIGSAISWLLSDEASYVTGPSGRRGRAIGTKGMKSRFFLSFGKAAPGRSDLERRPGADSFFTTLVARPTAGDGRILSGILRVRQIS
jgi:hypothetical protein